MYVLVTGATGFVGFHTVLALIGAGHKVRLCVRSKDKMDALFAPYGIDTSDYAIADITDKQAIETALSGVDAVIHTAAMVSVDPSMAEQMYHTNVTGTKTVIGTAVAAGIESIVYVSSLSTLFDPTLERIDETTPLAQPKNPYATAKLESELYVRELIEQGANIAVSIPALIIGPDDPMLSEGNAAMALYLNMALMNTTTGQQIIDVRELAKAHVGLLEQNKSGLYIVSGHYLSWQQLGRAFDSVLAKRIRKLYAPQWLLALSGRAADWMRKFIRIDFPLSRESVSYAAQWVYADDSKLRTELAMEYIEIEKTLADTCAWLADNKHINQAWLKGH